MAAGGIRKIDDTIRNLEDGRIQQYMQESMSFSNLVLVISGR